MKTKLSFLALPLYLGIALAFVLEACGGGGGSSPGDDNSSSGGAPYNPSSPVTSDNVSIEGLRAQTSGTKVRLDGNIYGTREVHVVRVIFVASDPSWFWYDGNRVPSNGTVTVDEWEIDLRNDVGVYIDLEKSCISSGTYQFTVKACIDANCSTGKVATANSSFTVDQNYCDASSSSEGGGAASSSSQAVWKFGGQTTVEVSCNNSVNLGGGSFRLTTDDCEANGTQPGISVTGGTIIGGLGKKMSGTDVTPSSGTPYTITVNGRTLGSTVPSVSSISSDDGGPQDGDYFMIYIGSDRYLIRFKPSGDLKWGNWPKQGEYWQATEHP